MHALTDGHGRVLAFRLSGGNVHDSRAFAALLDAVRVPRRGAGRPHTRPGCPSPPRVNGLTPGYRMYRSGLVPRGMAMLRLIGGARIFAPRGPDVQLGMYDQSPPGPLLGPSLSSRGSCH